MKRLLLVAAVLLLVSTAAAVGLWRQYQHFLAQPLALDEAGLVLEVQRGANIRSVVYDLEQRGVTRMDWRWRLLTRLRAVTIKAGEYALPPRTTPPELLALLASGKVVSYRFTIVEGWTVKQLLAALDRDPVLEQTVDAPAALSSLFDFEGGRPEGWFLPETYVYTRGDTDVQILQRAYAAMRRTLEEVWSGRATGLPYETPYELLVMASIIEKETSLDDERETIAGVFVRRLLKNWRLETDPTVIYGMGDAYQGDIRSRDLKQDTPYNTYTRRGLPPTPIALPGAASLRAAAHPADGEAMFFVADGQGGHRFSSTLEAHNEAVRQLARKTAGSQDTQE